VFSGREQEWEGQGGGKTSAIALGWPLEFSLDSLEGNRWGGLSLGAGG